MQINISKNKKRLYLAILIASVFIIDVLISLAFNLSTTSTFLLFLASPVILAIFLIVIKPKLIGYLRNEKRIHDAIQRAEKSIQKRMKKSKSKPFNFGDKAQHTVFGTHKLDAQKKYKKYVEPLTLKKPKQVYYYVSAEHNNLND